MSRSDSPATDPAGVPPPRRIGGAYALQEEIGGGATGTVWRALESSTGEQVAIKLLRDDLAGEPKIVMRFVQERAILRMLRHPHIVGVRELLTVGSSLGLVMDLIPGGSLRRRLRTAGTLPPAEAAVILGQTAAALSHAHRRGVVHRDLKPDNILLTSPGAADPTVRLTDFGVARVLDGARLTTTGAVIGTAGYLAPEVIAGGRPMPAADVYALGIVLFELLLGRPPFAGATPYAALHGFTLPRPASVPEPAWHIIESCLASDPTHRPTAAELIDRFRALADATAGLPALDALHDSLTDGALPILPRQKPVPAPPIPHAAAPVPDAAAPVPQAAAPGSEAAAAVPHAAVPGSHAAAAVPHAAAAVPHAAAAVPHAAAAVPHAAAPGSEAAPGSAAPPVPEAASGSGDTPGSEGAPDRSAAPGGSAVPGPEAEPPVAPGHSAVSPAVAGRRAASSESPVEDTVPVAPGAGATPAGGGDARIPVQGRKSGSTEPLPPAAASGPETTADPSCGTTGGENRPADAGGRAAERADDTDGRAGRGGNAGGTGDGSDNTGGTGDGSDSTGGSRSGAHGTGGTGDGSDNAGGSRSGAHGTGGTGGGSAAGGSGDHGSGGDNSGAESGAAGRGGAHGSDGSVAGGSSGGVGGSAAGASGSHGGGSHGGAEDDGAEGRAAEGRAAEGGGGDGRRRARGRRRSATAGAGGTLRRRVAAPLAGLAAIAVLGGAVALAIRHNAAEHHAAAAPHATTAAPTPVAAPERSPVPAVHAPKPPPATSAAQPTPTGAPTSVPARPVARTSAPAAATSAAATPEAVSYTWGATRCDSVMQWATTRPAVIQTCYAIGPAVRLSGVISALPGTSVVVSLHLVEESSGRTVAGPFTCPKATFTRDDVQQACGGFDASVPRGRRYAVVQTWRSTAQSESRLAPGTARTQFFTVPA